MNHGVRVMLETFAFLFTYILLGTVGYFVSHRFKKPLTVGTFIVLLVVTIASQAILPTVRLIDIFGCIVYVGPSLQALLAGILLGRTIKAIKTAST